MLEIFVLFGHCLCCVDVSKWLAGAYKSSGNHLDHQRQPVLIRDDRIKWLDFGQTPDPENLEAHPGFVWVKSGYSEAIARRTVQLTKQRNVDLTTDGLWAMPLNTGSVPVKACRLQDWEKLKKYVPNHKQGDVCPNGVPALEERGNDDNEEEPHNMPRYVCCVPLCACGWYTNKQNSPWHMCFGHGPAQSCKHNLKRQGEATPAFHQKAERWGCCTPLM